ncbi:MAG: hypothetical protein EOM76_10610 [Sphingobacteriia bacterium]|nr:hypothetical protein [Sphingobacteriia bacterium]
MEEKKANTYKIKRETSPVSQKAKDNLKHFNAIKKSILEAIGEEEVSVKQVAEKIKMSNDETLYYMMSLLKFGFIQVVGIDDMDEYYIYKIKK